MNIDTEICYLIGRAFAQCHRAKSVVVGHDARETSPEFAKAVSLGIIDSGADVLDIGLSGTEEVYWATSELNSCGGISVTASHNPINWNGLKLVKSGSRPLDPKLELVEVQKLAESQSFIDYKTKGICRNIFDIAKAAYVEKVLSFANLSNLKPLKVAVNFGNGAAGPTFDVIAKALRKNNSLVDFVCLNHSPNHKFPSGVPNPMLFENREETAKFVVKNKADIGIAFDGDFDRCFFFDEKGQFIEGGYIVSLLAELFLAKEPNSSVVHDMRNKWILRDFILQNGGKAIASKVGHAYFKQKMREVEAIYGGELSGHHYFRDFSYCDSGMIPWLLIIEVMSATDQPLSELLSKRRSAYPCSGEINFELRDLDKSIEKILEVYECNDAQKEELDELNFSFKDWRFNLRKSLTENLLRLNIETRGKPELLKAKIAEISDLIVE